MGSSQSMSPWVPSSSTTDLPLNCRPKREMMTESLTPRCCPCRCHQHLAAKSPIFLEVLVRKSMKIPYRKSWKGKTFTFKSRGVQLEKIIYKWVSFQQTMMTPVYQNGRWNQHGILGYPAGYPTYWMGQRNSAPDDGLSRYNPIYRVSYNYK